MSIKLDLEENKFTQLNRDEKRLYPAEFKAGEHLMLSIEFDRDEVALGMGSPKEIKDFLEELEKSFGFETWTDGNWQYVIIEMNEAHTEDEKIILGSKDPAPERLLKTAVGIMGRVNSAELVPIRYYEAELYAMDDGVQILRGSDRSIRVACRNPRARMWEKIGTKFSVSEEKKSMEVYQHTEVFTPQSMGMETIYA